jgi:hypothetical protein
VSADVEEKSLSDLASENKRIRVVRAWVKSLDSKARTVACDQGSKEPLVLSYDRLCIASGARPNLIADSAHVIGIRDTESVSQLAKRLSSARRVLVVGNGGIALELVQALQLRGLSSSECEVVWVMKDAYIGNTFLDRASSAFLIPDLFPDADPEVPSSSAAGSSEDKSKTAPDSKDAKDSDKAASAAKKPLRLMTPAAGDRSFKVMAGSSLSAKGGQRYQGGALGPEWQQHLRLPSAKPSDESKHTPKLTLEFSCDVTRCTDRTASAAGSESKGTASAADSAFPLSIELSSGRKYECDFLVSATGVVPNTEFLGSEVG